MTEREKQKEELVWGNLKLSRQNGRIVANHKCPWEDTESKGIAEPGISTIEANLQETDRKSVV